MTSMRLVHFCADGGTGRPLSRKSATKPRRSPGCWSPRGRQGDREARRKQSAASAIPDRLRRLASPTSVGADGRVVDPADAATKPAYVGAIDVQRDGGLLAGVADPVDVAWRRQT